MPDSIEDLMPLLGTTVWVQVGGYVKPEPADTDYDTAILTTILVDDMGMWAIVRWAEGVSADPDRIGTRFPWFRVDPKMPLVVQEAIYGPSYDEGAFDPEADYGERYNYKYGSSATGITEQA